METKKLPLDLVTGFLGSGKTSPINKLLRDPAFAGAMVIVNEFGEVGLDHLLVSSAEDRVLLLESGCLCCAASGTLRDTLIDLFSRRSSGTVPPFTRIIVETSGLAHPGPIVASLLGDSALLPRVHLSQVLTLVDAVNGVATIGKYREAQRQVAFADRLVMTKADIATPRQLQETQDCARALNQHAQLHVVSGDEDIAFLFDAPVIDGRKVEVNAGDWMRGPLRPQYGDDGSPVHGASFQQISTHTFRVPHAIDWPAYAAWSDAMRRRLGARLLRCKGLLAIGPPGAIDAQLAEWVIQCVQGYFAPPVRRAAYGGGEGFLVCIGEDLDRGELESMLALLAPEPHYQET